MTHTSNLQEADGCHTGILEEDEAIAPPMKRTKKGKWYRVGCHFSIRMSSKVLRRFPEPRQLSEQKTSLSFAILERHIQILLYLRWYYSPHCVSRRYHLGLG